MNTTEHEWQAVKGALVKDGVPEAVAEKVAQTLTEQQRRIVELIHEKHQVLQSKYPTDREVWLMGYTAALASGEGEGWYATQEADNLLENYHKRFNEGTKGN